MKNPFDAPCPCGHVPEKTLRERIISSWFSPQRNALDDALDAELRAISPLLLEQVVAGRLVGNVPHGNLTLTEIKKLYA
jgi:hypothetical protein